jgi:competence ComEA-like helix-hairpin-helix protein
MILLSLILLVIVVNFFIPNTSSTIADEETFAKWEEEVRAFQERQEIANQYNDSIRLTRQQYKNYGNYQYSNTNYYGKYQKTEKKFPQPFPFNPNEINKGDFVKLGFSEKQAESIVKYREKGKIFKTKTDFQKVFVVSDEMYAHLETWILLPDGETETVADNKAENAQEPLIVELNTADTTALKQIKGIGNYTAKRIVDYRQKLGGFHSIEQLREINGMDEERFANIIQYVIVDKEKVIKLDLNKNSFKDFTRHPYFEQYIIKAIFEYKDKNGQFSSVEDIRKIPLIYNDLYNKIYPYLQVSTNK